MTREDAFSRLTHAYEAYYNIETPEETSLPLIGQFYFYAHSEKYVLLKKAKLWSADSNEYVYLFLVPELTREIYESCRDFAYSRGMERIDPKPGHMCSFITAIFICDSCEKDAVRALKGCRLHKNFQFSLLGWMDFHTALIDLSSDSVATNGSGRANKKILTQILYPKTKKLKGGSK